MANSKATATKTATTQNKEKSVSELVATLAEQTGISKVKVKELLDAHSELLINELKTADSVQLSGLGKLKLGERPERQGRNPSTGETITIKASKSVKFAAGKRLKDSL
jgi:DNA-binding protein HU-beta